MGEQRPIGMRAAMRAWRASINVSEFAPVLTIVPTDDEICKLCGNDCGARGTEVLTFFSGYVHVGCLDGVGFGMKGGA